MLIGSFLRMAGAIILKLSYGYERDQDLDALIEIANRVTEEFMEAVTPGVFLVDVFPLLRYVPEWLPGTKFHAMARKWRTTLHKMADIPFQTVKQQMVRSFLGEIGRAHV